MSEDTPKPPEPVPVVTEKRRRGKRREDRDPRTGELLTPLSLSERVDVVENRARRDRIENRVMYIIAVLLAVGGGILYERVEDVSDDNTVLIKQQSEGRRLTLGVTCAALSAVIEAGRATISGGAVGPPEFVRNLEKLGFPPKDVRVKQAVAAGDAYSKAIADRVAAAVGPAGEDIVTDKGSLDCEKLRSAASVPRGIPTP